MIALLPMLLLSTAVLTLLELWLVLSVTFLTLLASLLLWYAYPMLKRVALCSWCWQDAHLVRFFPESWSSSICAHHERMQEEQAAARRRRRLHERSAS